MGKRLVTIGLCVLVATGAAFPVGYFVCQHYLKQSQISTTLDWARMNHVPPSATNIRISTQGSMFTREFTLKFDAPETDMREWLENSPGTESVRPVVRGTVETYKIEPGGGAQHAELQYDKQKGRVIVTTYWS